MSSSDPNYMKNYMKQRRLRRKLMLIDILGGKCIRCGEKDPSKLEFDHKTPRFKRFDISDAKDVAERILIREAKKCQLLCHNCHKQKTRENFEFGSKPSQHGTIWHYKRYQCRCDKCKKAMSEYLKAKKKKFLELQELEFDKLQEELETKLANYLLLISKFS